MKRRYKILNTKTCRGINFRIVYDPDSIPGRHYMIQYEIEYKKRFKKLWNFQSHKDAIDEFDCEVLLRNRMGKEGVFGGRKMERMESFVADDGKEKTRIELIRLRTFPKRYGYVIVRNSNVRDFFNLYFTKFFAKRMFDKIKRGYKSCWLTYGVYDDSVYFEGENKKRK